MTYKAIVNDQEPIDIQIKSDGAILLNKNEMHLEPDKINEHTYHIISQQQTFNVEVLQADFKSRKFLLKINGKPAEVVLRDRFDQLIEQMGMQAMESEHEKEVKAPMPGLILNIPVKEGQEVNKGDTLLTLEAMKMENVIKAPVAGVISNIHIKEQQSVEKSQLLMVIG